MPPFMADAVAFGRSAARKPLVGITSGGEIDPVLAWPVLPRRGAVITEAASTFLGSLGADQRQQVLLPVDSEEWRLWFNIHPNVLRHGVILEDLSVAQRGAALELMRVTMSERGFEQARDVMRINGMLRDVTGMPDDFGEWPYFLTLFGEPSLDEPWGWQIDGHHLNLNVLVLGDRVAMSPWLMGSEPCRVDAGPLAGTEVLGDEERAGLDFIRSLNAEQLGLARRWPSILSADLPAELSTQIDGRMRAGAFQDNAVVPFEGLRADGLSDAQRMLLRRVVGTPS